MNKKHVPLLFKIENTKKKQYFARHSFNYFWYFHGAMKHKTWIKKLRESIWNTSTRMNLKSVPCSLRFNIIWLIYCTILPSNHLLLYLWTIQNMKTNLPVTASTHFLSGSEHKDIGRLALLLKVSLLMDADAAWNPSSAFSSAHVVSLSESVGVSLDTENNFKYTFYEFHLFMILFFFRVVVFFLFDFVRNATGSKESTRRYH